MIIGELAARSGVSPRLLRYYEEQGLLTATRAPNGYRQYDESAVEIARTVRMMFQMGFPQEKVRSLLACASPSASAADHEAARARVAEMRDDVDRQMTELARTREVLTEFLGR
ncbi:DNA-binding transcriptional regulator, MerR family [Promicromonospora thailandica]|uniref:DNA-binding transcriptional regulator, MerR family n=1 Tax=Promicromonospora thailandica TaxID=765201 RepID=A0A9X2JTU2_9MICO|nr:DNA-binding transcriptional regulator, MerR family [Promicromonospora thailandica]